MMRSAKLIPILLMLTIFSCVVEPPVKTFTINKTASPAEGGEVYLSPGWLDAFTVGQRVAVIPAPSEGWVFQQWQGDAAGTSNPYFFEMNSNKNIIGVFVRKEYTLDIEIIGEGTVTETVVQNPSGREYYSGTTVELTPIPKEGWVFESWGGDLSGNTNPMRIAIDDLKKVTVRFVPKPQGEPKFYLAENGITCKCENVITGDKGMINGVEYEAVNNEFLRVRLTAKSDMTKLCTSLVTDMSGLFSYQNFNQPIGNWDVSNVRNMSAMFAGSTFNQPIEKWDVSNVTNMSAMFAGIWGPTATEIAEMLNDPLGFWGDPDELVTKYTGTTFNQPIGNWNVNKVTNMAVMFFGSNFDQPLENWDVSSVTNMSGMFGGISEKMPVRFRQSISEWDVGNVTNMNGMFVDNHYFNHDLSNWCVTKIPTIPKDFTNYNSAWTLPKPVWGTCPE
jgi:surface protein